MARLHLRAVFFSSFLALGFARHLAAQAIYTPYRFITLAGSAGASGEIDGTGSAARFGTPLGVAVDRSGNIYIADNVGNTIRQITPGGVVATLAGSAGVEGSADGVGTAAQFDQPYGVAVDAGGNVYVADTFNCTIRKITPTVAGGVTTWTVTTLAGDPNLAKTATRNGHFDGTGGGATFYDPTSVAVDGSGTVYVADSENYDIRKVTPDGVVTTFAGVPETAGDVDGTGSGALFDRPTGVAVDGSGNVYVSDTVNNQIREITPGGAVTTVAGIFGSRTYVDGSVSVAQFTQPAGLAVDGNGNVYFADPDDATVRKLTPAGVVTTIAGIPDVGGSSNGTGAGAKFRSPFYVAVDASGNVYVSDSGNDTVREGTPSSVAPTFTLPASPSTVAIGTGRTVVFNAIVAGTPAPTLQWTLNGSATIPGATVTNDPILVITGATASDNGTITCTASNGIGSPAASSATLSVIPTTTPGYLDNLSGRGLVGSGASNALYGGFGISGTGTKQLLIRGMGPSLLPGYIFTVSDALQDTQLTLFNNNSVAIASNSPWGGTAALMAADSLVGAYPPVSTTSLDSMLFVPVGTGPSSASIAGVNGDTGDAVIEIYDADSPPLAAKLTNLAVRAPVGTGNDILFGGFAIGGSTEETVLIRAIGPGLATTFPGSFAPSQVLAQPVLTLYAGSTPIYSNTVWGGDQALINAMLAVGAYPLVNSSADSLLLVTLPPGEYSAEISGLNNTTGIAVVEVYEVQ